MLLGIMVIFLMYGRKGFGNSEVHKLVNRDKGIKWLINNNEFTRKFVDISLYFRIIWIFSNSSLVNNVVVAPVLPVPAHWLWPPAGPAWHQGDTRQQQEGSAPQVEVSRGEGTLYESRNSKFLNVVCPN